MPRLPQDKFQRSVRIALLDEGMTVSELARRVGKSRNAVSMAINHPVYPTVRKLIARKLKLEAAL